MKLASVTVREATFDLLRCFGMTTIFGNPGSTELPMFRDFPEGFRYVLGLQESVVLGMADGYAQATRRPALVNLHSAAGVGHSLGNVFTAFKNQTPLVITAGQQARSILPYEPFLFADRPTEFPRPYVKWSCEPARAQEVPAAIARAYYIAMQPPCGPTFVSIPVDDWDQLCEPITGRQISTRQEGDAQLLGEIATSLDKAKRPALVLGAGVARDGAWNEAILLAERHNASVWIAPFSAQISFPETHHLFAGFLAPIRENIVEALNGHDVILVIGGPLSLYHVEGNGPHVPSKAKLFIVTDSPAVATWAPVGTALICGAKAALTSLLQGPRPVSRETPKRRPTIEKVEPTALTDMYLLQQIAALRPSTSVIVEEAPSSRTAMHDHLPLDQPDSFYTCASGGLGHGLPAAVGIALGRPHNRVIAILGDGSAMYAIQGLWSAAQQKLSISFIIVKNRRYQALISFGRHFGLRKTLGTELPDIDFCALARAQGVHATHVTAPEYLNEALRASFDAPGPSLVEVEVT